MLQGDLLITTNNEEAKMKPHTMTRQASSKCNGGDDAVSLV